MNIITKTVEAFKEAKYRDRVEKQEARMKEIDEFMKKNDIESYNMAHMANDIINNSDGYMLMATKLVTNEQGVSELRHQSLVSKTFKLDDIFPSCEEYKKLGEDMIKKREKEIDEELKASLDKDAIPAPDLTK